MTTRRQRTNAARGRSEALGMLVSCIGAAALFALVSPQLLLGVYGIAFGIGAGLSSLLAIIAHIRAGGSCAGALLTVLTVSAVTIGCFYGLWWWFFVQLASKPLFTP